MFSTESSYCICLKLVWFKQGICHRVVLFNYLLKDNQLRQTNFWQWFMNVVSCWLALRYYSQNRATKNASACKAVGWLVWTKHTQNSCGPPDLYVTRHKLQKKTVGCTTWLTINCASFTRRACTVASFHTKIRPKWRVRTPLIKFLLLWWLWLVPVRSVMAQVLKRTAKKKEIKQTVYITMQYFPKNSQPLW